jgi:hypothetical protein
MSRCLHHNSLGCVAQCAGSCCLHLYFGNVGLCLRTAELAEWCATVAGLYKTHLHRLPDPQARTISLLGPTAGVVFLFSLEELAQLQDLLVSAALLLEVNELLKRPITE